MQEDALWKTAQSENTFESYETYISEYANGKYSVNANNIIVAIDDSLWNIAVNLNTEIGYNNYINKMPNGKYIEKANGNLIAFEPITYCFGYENVYNEGGLSSIVEEQIRLTITGSSVKGKGIWNSNHGMPSYYTFSGKKNNNKLILSIIYSEDTWVYEGKKRSVEWKITENKLIIDLEDKITLDIKKCSELYLIK